MDPLAIALPHDPPHLTFATYNSPPLSTVPLPSLD
jgi:hypothetical protein